MKDTLLVISIIAVILVLAIGIAVYFSKSKEGFKIIKNQPEIEEGYNSYKTYTMNSVDPDYGYSTASVFKLCKENKVTLSVEANLPLAEGGDFNTEDTEYYLVYNNEKLTKLERDLDRFYRGSVEIKLLDKIDASKPLKIIASGSRGEIEILTSGA